MKKFKHLALLLLAAVVVFGCSKYDDTELRNDVSDLQSRVEKLESWCTTTNTQISALQGLVTALEGNDYVTGVTPIMEGTKEVGYTITFTKSKPITILHGKDGVNGKDGVSPIIGVAKDADEHYYWTVKIGDAAAVWMTDASGNKIRTTGDKGDQGDTGADGQPGIPGADGQPGTPGADGQPGLSGADGADGHSPVLSVAEFEGRLYWKIDGEWLLSDGNKVPATGDKGDKGDTGATGSAGATGAQGSQGDAVFKKDGVTSYPDKGYVEFELANGNKIQLPLFVAAISFDAYTPLQITATATETEVKVTLPTTLKKADFAAIKADITNVAGTNSAITRAAAPEKWTVALTAPTFKDDGTLNAQPTVKVTVPASATLNETALLEMTVVDTKGNKSTSTRVLYYSNQVAVTGVTLDNTTLTVKTGKTGAIIATIAPANASNPKVNWTTSDATVATVADGTVTGVLAGTATITATTEDGSFTATCVVTVENIDVTSITLADATVSIGDKKTLTATIAPADATVQTLTWSSNNTNVATINATTGEVTGVAIGEVTITATSTSNPTVTATCKVTVEDIPDYIELNGIKVAVGNLVANGPNGAKIGTATDGGLFFQFGSLVGWSTTGDPTVAVSPVGCTVTSWNSSWTGDSEISATDDAASGKGDPCRYYLKGTWRLPTKDEYVALFKDGGYPSGTWKWENASATNTASGLTFPASGFRYNSDGSLYYVGTHGYCWSASPNDASFGYYLYFYSSFVNPSSSYNRASGLPVRCVK